MQASFGNRAFTISASEVDLMKIENAGQVIQYPQVFEFRGIELTDEAKAQISLSPGKKRELEEFLTTARTNFALDSRTEFENPTTWNLSNLSETSLTFSNEQATIDCKHSEVSRLFNDFGLVAQ